MAAEERTIAARRAAVVVARRIARGISLGLDDAAAETARGKVMDDDFADKKTSELDRVRGEFRKLQAANGDFLCAAPRRQNGLIIFLAVLCAMFRSLSKFSLPSFLYRCVHRLTFSGGSLAKRRASSACSMTPAESSCIASKDFFWQPSPDSERADMLLASRMALLVSCGVMGASAATA